MKLGYARCSTLDQNLDWQIDALTKEGCDRIFQEKFTETRKDRPELLRMVDMLREGGHRHHLRAHQTQPFGQGPLRPGRAGGEGRGEHQVAEGTVA